MTLRPHSLTACLLALLALLARAPAPCTSPQIELSEPILTLDDQAVHGTAFFGAPFGSHVYSTAGDLGATFPLGHVDGGKPYFFGDMFTWIRNPSGCEFEPRRIIYTLELGYYWEVENNGYRFFAKHQSFHDVDFYDSLDKGYELYGLSYRRKESPEFYASVGKYMNDCIVDYQWDLVAATTFALPPVWEKETYLHLWLHQVTENDGPGGRDGFLDYAAEVGIKFDTGVTLFTRYEFLHDINYFGGAADRHFLTGAAYRW